LEKYKKNILNKIKKLKETGFFSIFLSNILSKVVVFFGNIIVVRILSQKDYGIYAYAINAFSILYILNDFGASCSALQSITEEKDNAKKQQAILKYSFKMGMIGSICSGILIFLAPLFYPFNIVEAKYLVPILCLVPVFSMVKTMLLILLRANFENNKYAILNLAETVLSYLFLIILSLFFGIKGAIVSKYFYIIISVILGFFLTKKLRIKTDKTNILDKKEKKAFTKYAITTQITNTLGSILIYIDTFMIGYILSTAESVAIYKVASTIPSALSFIPTCVMIYVLPYFVLHNKDKKWLKTRYNQLIKFGIIGYGIITVILIIASKLIIQFLYTDIYMESLYPFIILLVGFFISSAFTIPTDNVLASMRKLNFKIIITIISGTINILLNVLFINKWGLIGAALATVIANIISAISSIIYVERVIYKMPINNYNEN